MAVPDNEKLNILKHWVWSWPGARRKSTYHIVDIARTK